ncbi:hypothetical protein FOXB_06538 [Fusarium oxysporum f. sp. conglutinans Fo5176]|uniref:Uncharacterized protein n=1 Tax=Fusarium oxysporum (strain Fo5176) TaxID=660025 RepID=F9FJF9_FUSOF|nr:hypothetical protein FOXB_06538 [Fusarium oxysporum f. sp. conglutinans Fo5176]
MFGAGVGTKVNADGQPATALLAAGELLVEHIASLAFEPDGESEALDDEHSYKLDGQMIKCAVLHVEEEIKRNRDLDDARKQTQNKRGSVNADKLEQKGDDEGEGESGGWEKGIEKGPGKSEGNLL